MIVIFKWPRDNGLAFAVVHPEDLLSVFYREAGEEIVVTTRQGGSETIEVNDQNNIDSDELKKTVTEMLVDLTDLIATQRVFWTNTGEGWKRKVEWVS